MILTLLIKMVEFHVRLISIYFRDLSLKGLFLWFCYYLSPSLYHLHKHLHEFGEKVFNERRNKRWSKSLQRGKNLSRNLIALGVKFLNWALAGKFTLFSSAIGWRINMRAPSSTRSWSHCNGDLIVILPNKLTDPFGMALLELLNRQSNILAGALLVSWLGGKYSAWMEEDHVQGSHNVIT